MTNNSPALHTSRFDVGRYLAGDAVMADYLTDCYEEGGTALFLKAIGEVARARGMSELANRTGLTRASLYKALAEDGNPAFDTLARVLETLGFRLAVVANTPAAPVVARDKRSESTRVRVMETPVAYGTQTAKATKATAGKAKKARKSVAKKR